MLYVSCSALVPALHKVRHRQSPHLKQLWQDVLSDIVLMIQFVDREFGRHEY